MTSCIVPGCITQKSGARLSLHLFPDPSREPERHLRWARKINSEKVFSKDPPTVFKQLRVCRAHFDDKSFNGSCKKLLNTAIPTLHIAPSNVAHFKTKLLAYEAKVKSILQQNSIDINKESFQLVSEAEPSIKALQKIDEDDELSAHDKMWLSGIDDEDGEEQYELVEIEEASSVNQKFTLVVKNDKKTPKKATQPLQTPKTILQKIQSKEKNSKIKPTLAPLTISNLQKLRDEFLICPKKLLAQSLCTRIDPLEVAISRSKLELSQHFFLYTIDLQRCKSPSKMKLQRSWDAEALNMMRIPFMKHLNIEEFEFSQAYFFYWDKIERSYFFLNNIVETAKRGEEVNGRLVSFLLSDPIGDGGQWDMIVNIINKHGVMPRKCFPESFSCESSSRMNAILKSKLREFAKQIRDLFSSGASEGDLQAKVDLQMNDIYNIVGICLGIPPVNFTWEYYDKNKKYNSVGPVTALEFYEKYVKQHFNVDDKVCLVTDPRPPNDFGKGYTVDCLGNVVGGRSVFYNNQPVDVLMDLVGKSIKAGEAVWFGCDLKKRLRLKNGIKEMDLVNYELLFGNDVELGLSKADRLIYGDSFLSHAMVFTGVCLDDKEVPTKFRVEHSLSDEGQDSETCLTMTSQWFKEFVFQVVIDQQQVDDDTMRIFDSEPVVLPAWDPIGTLAL